LSAMLRYAVAGQDSALGNSAITLPANCDAGAVFQFALIVGANAYRDYAERDVHEIKFIRRARKLGFSIEEIRELLALWRDRGRPSSEVRRIASAHVTNLETRMAELHGMIATLRHLIDACPGDAAPDCPILADLEGKRRN